MTKIDKPGIYPDLPEKEYHADPVIEPSLSKSVGANLIHRTAKHCYLAHPRLNPEFVEENKTDYDVGKAAHRLLLEGRKGFVIIDSDAFRTNAAKAERDDAYNAGKTPLLKYRLAEVEAMVESAKGQLKHSEELSHVLDTHKPEVTIVWTEETAHGRVWCRSRIDLFPEKGTVVVDYKSTTDANPENWRNRAFDLGYDIQSGFIRRGLRAVAGIESAEMRFIVQETKPPYVLSIVGLEPEGVAMGDEKVEEMIRRWAKCRATDSWPGYFKSTVYMGPPPWEATKWLSQKTRHEMFGISKDEMHDLMIDWQKPVETGNAAD